VACGNGIHDSSFDHFINDFPLRPSSHRTTGFFDRLAGHSKDHRELLGCKCRRPSAALFIRKNVFNGPPKFNRFFDPFDQREPFELLLPAFPPGSHLVRPQLHRFCDIPIEPFFERQ